MNVCQKEIVLLSYPFSDLTKSKVRPALVISNDNLNKRGEDCIMVPLTTVIKDEPYSVLISNQDLASGSLLKPSRVRLDKVFSVKKEMVYSKIGILNDKTFAKIKSELVNIF